jgi:hypothetical protein
MKVVALILVGLCVSPVAARAAGGDEDALIRRGLQLRRAGHDEAAVATLQQAYGQEASPRAAAQLGFAEQAAGQWTKAGEHVDEALRAANDPWIDRNRAIIEHARGTIAAHLTRHPPLAASMPPAFGPEAPPGASLVVTPIAPLASDTGHKKVMLGLTVGGVGIAALLAGGAVLLASDSSTATAMSPAAAPSLAVVAPALPMDPKNKKASPELALMAAPSAVPSAAAPSPVPSSHAWAADTLFVVGGAALLTGGALVIMGKKSQREARGVQTVSLRPLLAAGSVGAAVNLGF